MSITLPPLVAGIWNKANFPFHQPGLFTGFWVASSWHPPPPNAYLSVTKGHLGLPARVWGHLFFPHIPAHKALVNQFLTNWNPSGWIQTLGCLGCCLELTRHAITTLTKSLYLKSNPTPLTIYSPTWALQWSLFQSLLALHVWRSVFKPKRKSVHFIWGEGNGNPLQYSCLENPVDRGAWRAAVHRVAQSRTRMKRLSSSSSSFSIRFNILGH